MRAFFVLLALAVVAAALLAAQNVQKVTLNFLGWHTQPVPLAWVIIGAIIAGAGVASLFWLTATVRVSVQVGKLKSSVRRLEKELGRRGDPAATRREKA